MRPATSAVFLMLACSLLSSVAQLLYKLGAQSFGLSGERLLASWPIAAGLMSYGAALLLMLRAYEHGRLSFLYSINAMAYVWVMLMAPLFFDDEVVTRADGLGVALIVVGITLVGTRRS